MKNIKEILNNINFKNDFLKYYISKNIMDLEYFGDLYKNFRLVKLKNNKTSLMKLSENRICGFTNEIFGSLFLGIGKDDEYESQFIYYEDVEKIFLKNDEFINILNFFDDILKTKKITDLIRYLNKKVEKNNFDEILKLRQIGMNSSYKSNNVERDIEKLISFFKNLIFNDTGKIKNNKIKTSLYVNKKSKSWIFDILSKEKNNAIFKEKDLNDNKNWNFFLEEVKSIKENFKKKFYSEEELNVDNELLNIYYNQIKKEMPEIFNGFDNDLSFYLIDTNKNNQVNFNDRRRQTLDCIYKISEKIEKIELENNDFIGFIEKSSKEILNNSEQDKIYKGMIFFNDDMFYYTKKNSYIVVKNKSETIAMMNFYSDRNSRIKKIGTISIDYRYRNKGLLKTIYNKLNQLGIEEKYMFITDNYTNQGRKKIPKIKKEIMDESKNFNFIDTTYSDFYSDLEISFNREFVEILNTLSENEYIIKEKKIKKIYSDGLSFLRGKEKMSYDEQKKLFNDLLKEIVIQKKIKKLNK